jgi:drug/metabolite transporter (DMT)-like permease
VLDKLPVSIVSLYNYINPIVAVFLGWLIYREPVGWREMLAMGVIFSGVAVVKRFSATVTATPLSLSDQPLTSFPPSAAPSKQPADARA